MRGWGFVSGTPLASEKAIPNSIFASVAEAPAARELDVLEDESKGDRKVENETKTGDKKSSLLGQILIPVVIAVLAGGSSPWWFNAVFNKPAPKPDTSNVVVNPQPAPAPPAPAPAPVASREFFIGRWRVDQMQDGVHGVNTVDYFDSGRFEGHDLMANGYQGRDVPESGTWMVEKISNQSFRLMTQFDTGLSWRGTFKIIDQDHIQNIDDNYVAERVK
jgi:hypothetical protein